MAVWDIIPGKLWQGDILAAAKHKADCVISCTFLAEVVATPLSIVEGFPLHVFFPFLDTVALPDMETAHALAIFGAGRILDSKTVLVHCNAGCNRSGLICGMIMQSLGMTDVVNRIRKAHPEALNNTTFASYLAEQEEWRQHV